MPSRPRKPPASTIRTPGQTGTAEKGKASTSAILGGKTPGWPKTALYNALRPEFKRLRDDLLTSAHVSRGCIPADVGLADSAAMAAQTQAQWFAIGQKLITEANRENRPPDIRLLATATGRAEASGRGYRSAIEALGLKGSEFGAVRANKVAAVTGVASGEEEWDDV